MNIARLLLLSIEIEIKLANIQSFLAFQAR